MDTDYYKQYEPFFGSWKIVRLIGEGTYGKVFEICRSEYGFEEKAALKIISIPASKSEYNSVLTDCMDERSATEYFRNYMQEMIREISLMSKLKGNSYIVCYEDHEVKNRAETVGWDIMIRMELLTPLNEYAREKKPREKDDVIRLGIDICKALEICQKYDIIHRDIKPENIFVTDYGNFKLGDFGIARIASQTSGASTRAGTNAYMAPEVYRGEHYGKTVDLYSLGLVLYRLLNDNRLPFMPQYPTLLRFQDRENAQAMRLSGAPIPAPTHADPVLANVIAKACAYNAEDRFATATDMRLALESALQPEGTVNCTAHIESESSQPNTDAVTDVEADDESDEATISRFADGKTSASPEEAKKVEKSQSVKKDDFPFKDSANSSTAFQSPKARLTMAQIINEYLNEHWLETFEYASDIANDWSTLLIDDVNSVERYKVERKFDKKGNVKQVNVTYDDGRTESYNVSFETDTQKQNMTIRWKINNPFSNDGYSIVISYGQKMLYADMNAEHNGTSSNKIKIACGVTSDSTDCIKELHYYKKIAGKDSALLDTYIFNQIDKGNRDIYNVTSMSGDSRKFVFFPNIGQGKWEKLEAESLHCNDKYTGILLYRGDRAKALTFGMLTNFVSVFTLGLNDSILLGIADPFGIGKYFNIDCYKIDAQLTYLSFDCTANPTMLIGKLPDSKKYQVTWIYESMNTH